MVLSRYLCNADGTGWQTQRISPKQKPINQKMQKQRTSHSNSSCSSSARCILVILLVACLAECATEQRINNRGSKPSNLINKANGWRSQRGGSCLSYGHSCWGAHGKRSGTAPSSAPDWYITRMLRRMAAINELNHPRQPTNEEMNDIFRVEVSPEISSDGLISVGDTVQVIRNNADARPMLDDAEISKMKIWQIMKAAAENE